MKTVGVIGGMGPMATVYFLELLTQKTNAGCDQEHLRVITASIPDAPDRTAYILGKSRNSPFPHMREAGRRLVLAGAEFIAIPCVTAQYFQRELEQEIGVPVISTCRELAGFLRKIGVLRAGIIATTGTISSRVLQDELEREGIESLCPDKRQQEKIMSVIYREIKQGRKPDVESFLHIGNLLKERGAQKVILGCTELSLLKKECRLPSDYVDVLEVLAAKTITMAGASLREDKN